MRLERIFRHRIVRTLQVALPILVAVLAAVPAWNYYARLVQRSGPVRVGTKLPSGVSVRTDGFSFTRTDGGRTQFTVRAKQSLGFKDDKYILQDVDVIVYGQADKDPTRNIRGKNCTFDQGTNDFTCNGDVEVHLDEKTIVRTQDLIYNHQNGLVTAPQRAALERDGTTGHSNNFEYAMMTGLLKLNGDVAIRTPDGVEIQTASGLFQQKENWATMAGGVLIKSENGWVRGVNARADLRPETFKPKLITIVGGVTAESRSAADSWKLRSDWLEATVSETGSLERVKTRGNVDLEKIASSRRQRLSGAEVDAIFKDDMVDVLNARQNARMVIGADQTLEAPEISTNAAGLIQTRDVSVLKFGDSTIHGRDFTITNTEDLVSFTTPRRATLKKDPGQESSSDQTQARFDSRTNMLLELVQTGNFQFRTPQYEGRAQTGRFEEGGAVVNLEGSPTVSDAEKTLRAAKIRVDQRNNSFVATTNVSTLMKNSEDTVLVKASRGESSADGMLYTGAVELWRGDAYIKAERLEASGQERGQMKVHAEAPGSRVDSRLQNVRATSDTLDYDDSHGTVHYLGHVRANRQDMVMETPDLTVNFRDGRITQIVAIQGVTATRTDQRGTGEKAVYDAITDVVTLTGKNAQVFDKERGLAQGPSLTMMNKGQNVSVKSGNGERTVTRHPVTSNKK